MAGGWFFDGGGRAHVATLVALGYKCRHEAQHRWFLHNEELRRDLTVPRERSLSRSIRRDLVDACGFSVQAYLEAWNRKSRRFRCDVIDRLAQL
jgi:hypothetical protein